MRENVITCLECPTCGGVGKTRHRACRDAGHGAPVERRYIAEDALKTPSAARAAALIWISPVNGEDQIGWLDEMDMRRSIRAAIDHVTGGDSDEPYAR